MVDPLEQFKVIFYEEGAEAIDAIEQNLLAFSSGNTDSETINDIFRAAHSLKGGSATFGMSVLTDFTHLMETLLDKVRSEEFSFSQDIVDCLFSSLDVLRNIIAHYQYKDELNQQDLASVMDRLSKLLSGENVSTSNPVAQAHAGSNEACCWNISFAPYHGIMCQGNDPLRYVEELADLGEVEIEVNSQNIPDFLAINPTSIYMSWQVTLTASGNVSEEELHELFSWVEDDADIVFEQIQLTNAHQSDPIQKLAQDQNLASTQISSKQKDAFLPSNATDKQAVKRNSQSIRVALDKIDALINLLGELVITQSMLGVFGDTEKYPEFERLSEGLAQLERHTRELQEGVMRIRMLPIDFCFNRFPRMVRDLSKQLGKQIDVEIIGESTEVDKTVIEELNDPLVHLVRNSADHGIETPKERQALGKSEIGKITLQAFNQVGNIVIIVSDDGAGLDPIKLKKKAIEKGLIEAQSSLSQNEIYNLIFAPGFSTSEHVTDVSGRGVGMDVVRSNIQNLGGLIDVASTPNEGTKFTIRLPLTLAILDGQLIQVGDEIYIIPMLSIIESIQLNWCDINQIGSRDISFKWRDNYIPIIDLGKLFSTPISTKDKPEKALIVIVEHDNKQCGLLVDQLTNHQQVVVKSLEANYAKVDEFAGATILGDGTVALIINVASIASRVRLH